MEDVEVTVSFIVPGGTTANQLKKGLESLGYVVNTPIVDRWESVEVSAEEPLEDGDRVDLLPDPEEDESPDSK